MRLSSAAALLILLAAATSADAARSSRGSSSYRSSSRYYYSSYRSYSGSYYSSYRGPVYTRRLSPSLMGALYFSYASRYPAHFSYRRPLTGSYSGATCINYMALDNGSVVGAFTCPFLVDEPSGWTKCCGYEAEQFCCDPAYDDSWRLGRGLSIVAIVFIIGGCVTGFALFCYAAFYCFKKRSAAANRTGAATASAVATAASASYVPSPQTYVAPVQVLSKTAGGEQIGGSNPPLYPAFDYGQQTGMENRGFEPSPYPLYPPPYASPGAGGVGGPH